MAQLPGHPGPPRKVEQLGPTMEELAGRTVPGGPAPRVQTAEAYVSSRSPRRAAPLPKADRGTLSAGAPISGQQLLQHLQDHRSPAGAIPEVAVPQPPRLSPDELPLRARERILSRSRVPSLADVKAESQINLSQQSQEVVERLGAAAKQATAASPPQPEVETPGDAKAREEEMRIAERSIADLEIAKLFSARSSPMSETQRLLTSDERRKRIEDNLEPLNLEELFLTGSVQQTIPIILDRYDLVLRSLTQHELLFITQYMQRNAHGAAEAYVQMLYNSCIWTCALVQVSGRILPSHLVDEQTFDEAVDDEAFTMKLREFASLGSIVCLDVGIQYDWFIERIAKELAGGDAIKNG